MLLLANFIGSTEFYVIAFVVAMALLALMMHPKERNAAITLLAVGESRPTANSEPMIEVEADRSGMLRLTRSVVTATSTDGTFAVAVKVSGSDIRITEKYTPKRGEALQATTYDVTYEIANALHAGKYHIRYESDIDGFWAAGWLSVPAVVAKRMPLHQ